MSKKVKVESIKKMSIPVCRPTLGGNELQYVTEVIKSGWISSLGPKVKEFEQMFAKWQYGQGCSGKIKYNLGYAVSCSNGTVALDLALHALRIGKNYGGKETDEVIIPDFTMIAVPNSVHWSGAKLKLVDVRLSDWNMNPNKIEETINKNTKAIIVVHTYGHPAPMDEIMELAERYNLKVIEDCAEAHGAMYKKEKVGTFGDIAIYSFYANKIITTGEGGMVCTMDKKLSERIFSLKEHMFWPKHHFWHREIGHNHRLTAIQSAVGIAQMEKLDDYIYARRKNAAIYIKKMEYTFDKYCLDTPDTENLDLWIELFNPHYYQLPIELKDCYNVYWMFGVLVDDKKFVRKYLKDRGIETRSFFIPVHQQKPYLEDGVTDEDFPVSSMLYEHGFYLPSASDLTLKEISYVCKTMIAAIEEVEKNEDSKDEE